MDGTEHDNRVLDEIEQAVQILVDMGNYSPAIPLASSLSANKTSDIAV